MAIVPMDLSMLFFFIILPIVSLGIWIVVVASLGKEVIAYLPVSAHNSAFYSSKDANVRLLHQIAYRAVRVSSKSEIVCLKYVIVFIVKIPKVQTGVKIGRLLSVLPSEQE